MSTPDWTQWLNSVWGPETDDPADSDLSAIISAASNVVVGTNPPYTIQDFFAFYPKWGGTPLNLPGTTTTSGSANVTVASSSGLAVGNPVMGSGIPDGTFVQAIAGTTVTLTNAATASGTITLTAWNAPAIPIFVLTTYIALATASLVQARWLDTWTFAMALFVAHFASLYAKSDGTPNSTIGQIAAQGLSNGVQVAKGVGDVSVSYQPVEGIESWGAFNLTSYGQQLATMAKVIGAGPLFLW